MSLSIEKILANECGVTAVNCVPAIADVFSGTVPVPIDYPAVAIGDLSAWLCWFSATQANAAVDLILDEIGVVDVMRGDRIWGREGFLLPGQKPACGPNQFEFAHLLAAGADGGCIVLVCGVPGKSGFAMHVGVNSDGTRLLFWPENIGLGTYSPTRPGERNWHAI